MNRHLYNLYHNKDNKTLKSIIHSEDYTEEVKLCAIEILRKRGVEVEEHHTKEIEIKHSIREHRQKMKFASRYNTGFKRLVALIIDGFVIGGVNYLLGSFLSEDSVYDQRLLAIIGLFIPYVYSIFLHALSGQTIGKMMMQVKIYDKSEEKDISIHQAVLRDIVPLSILALAQMLQFAPYILESDFGLFLQILMSMTLVIWSLLEIVTMLFNTRKRALHDLLAGTVVLTVE